MVWSIAREEATHNAHGLPCASIMLFALLRCCLREASLVLEPVQVLGATKRLKEDSYESHRQTQKPKARQHHKA